MLTARAASRWSDNDRHCGPFTYARDGLARFGVMLDTGDSDYSAPAIGLRAHAFGRTLILWLRRPSRVPCGRQYGAFVSEGAVHVRYGRHAFDSRTDQTKVWFLPWMQWRHVRTSRYGLDGEHFATEQKGKWLEWIHAKSECPAVSFRFLDFDGEEIEATTRIEKYEWKCGEGWFRWLSLFRRPRVSRSLDIEFSSETGRRKGSWKGGTIGHGIDMRPGELHEAAFRRYCAEHGMTYLGVRPSRRAAGVVGTHGTDAD